MLWRKGKWGSSSAPGALKRGGGHSDRIPYYNKPPGRASTGISARFAEAVDKADYLYQTFPGTEPPPSRAMQLWQAPGEVQKYKWGVKESQRQHDGQIAGGVEFCPEKSFSRARRRRPPVTLPVVRRRCGRYLGASKTKSARRCQELIFAPPLTKTNWTNRGADDPSQIFPG